MTNFLNMCSLLKCVLIALKIYYNLWSMDIDTYLRYNTNTNTPTFIITWENHIILYNYMCWSVADIRTCLIQRVFVLHRLQLKITNKNWDPKYTCCPKPISPSTIVRSKKMLRSFLNDENMERLLFSPSQMHAWPSQLDFRT